MAPSVRASSPAVLAVAAGARLPSPLLSFDLAVKGHELFELVQDRLDSLTAAFGSAIPAATLQWVLGSAGRQLLDVLARHVERSPEFVDPVTQGLDAA